MKKQPCFNCKNNNVLKIKEENVALAVNKEKTKNRLFDLEYLYCTDCMLLFHIKDNSFKK